VLDRTIEHLGAERAGRYLRKHYPWYVERLAEAATARAGDGPRVLPDKELQAALQSSEDVEAARALILAAAAVPVPA
jgi:tRNA-dihydrouridine synthase B